MAMDDPLNTNFPAIFKWPGGDICIPCGKHEAMCVNVPPFDLVSGGIVSLHGDSGCGKSTFLAHLAGVADYRMLPRSVQKRMEALPTISGKSFVYVPQSPQFDRELSIRDECLYQWGRVYEGMDDKFIKKALGKSKSVKDPLVDLNNRLDELLLIFFPKETMAGVSEFKLKRISELSGGQLKRFGLLLRLPFHADILLLDEPDSGVDPETAISTLNWLKSAAFPGRTHPAILIVSHASEVREKVQDIGVRLEIKGACSCSIKNNLHDVVCHRIIKSTSVDVRLFQSDGGDYTPSASGLDCWHQFRLFFGSPGNFAMSVVPPLLIFLLLKISGWDLPLEGTENSVTCMPSSQWPCTSADANNIAKYLFFGVVSCMWLNLQHSSRTALCGTLNRKEQFWWTKGLLKHSLTDNDERNLYKFYAWDVFWSLTMTSVFIAIFVTILGMLVFFVLSPVGWLPTNSYAEACRPLMWIGFGYFFGAFYGGLVGIALGLGLAVIRMYPPRILRRIIVPARPNVNWLTFSIPLLTLLHIVISPLFIYGKAFSEMDTSLSTTCMRLAIVNPCSLASGITEVAFCRCDLWSSHVQWAIVTYFSISLLVALMIGWFISSLLNSPEVRTE
jgi:ABC-type multidrug transport system ATPase subunit